MIGRSLDSKLGLLMDTAEKERRGYLKDEYIFLQSQYEDFDKRSITIKGWVGSGSIVGLALSIDDTLGASLFVPFSIIVLALAFWFLETCWKVFQYSLISRIEELEAYFRDYENQIGSKIAPFQVRDSWFKAFAVEKKEFAVRGKQSFVHLPYSVIIFLALCSVGFRFF
jgi:hypothetical protein